jgi:hypothetical protein
MTLQKINDLINLATGVGNENEKRNAAILACQMLRKLEIIPKLEAAQPLLEQLADGTLVVMRVKR